MTSLLSSANEVGEGKCFQSCQSVSHSVHGGGVFVQSPAPTAGYVELGPHYTGTPLWTCSNVFTI